jgi:hypothetical protein
MHLQVKYSGLINLKKMKTMKTIKYLIFFVLGITALASCSSIVDDYERSEDFDTGPNLIGFDKASSNVAGISNGSEYVFELPMKGTGPTILDATADVTVKITVDPASTAVEGTNFTLSQNTVTLTAANNYLNLFPITMLTEGIIAPLDETPYVILNVAEVDSSGDFVDNGRTGQTKVNLLYLCFSNLAGDYSVEMDYFNNGDTGEWASTSFDDTLTETGPGQYRTGRVGHWTADDLGGTPGMDIIDLCNIITIPSQNLVDLYSNIVEGVPVSSVDPDTGVITFKYTVCAGYCREYFATYTPK